jgi:hypothetical protein
MSGQLTICFSADVGAPAGATPTATAPGEEEAGFGAPSADVPARALPSPLPRPDSVELPALDLSAGYEMYRDATRTVIRKPGEARWGATLRTGPTTHRFVGAGTDPGALWALAARLQARHADGAEQSPGAAEP